MRARSGDQAYRAMTCHYTKARSTYGTAIRREQAHWLFYARVERDDMAGAQRAQLADFQIRRACYRTHFDALGFDGGSAAR